jgi:hypothetical protein
MKDKMYREEEQGPKMPSAPMPMKPSMTKPMKPAVAAVSRMRKMKKK